MLIIIALGFMGNMVQSNSISAAFESLLGTPENGTLVKLITGVVCGGCGICLFGGSKADRSFYGKDRSSYGTFVHRRLRGSAGVSLG